MPFFFREDKSDDKTKSCTCLTGCNKCSDVLCGYVGRNEHEAQNVVGESIDNMDVALAADMVAGRYAADKPIPRYQCMISGFYSNRSLVLDAKSGIVNESTFSAAFNQSLRLGSSA